MIVCAGVGCECTLLFCLYMYMKHSKYLMMKLSTYNLTMPVIFLSKGNSWIGPFKSLILLHKDIPWCIKLLIKYIGKIIQKITELRVQITHNSFKLYNWEIVDGMGPSSPLECISLQQDKFLEGLVEITLQKSSKVESNGNNFFYINIKILQSSELFPVLHPIRECSIEVVIIYSATLH